MGLFSKIKEILGGKKAVPKHDHELNRGGKVVSTPVDADVRSTIIGRTHTVVKGETLSHIALHYYGNATKYDRIYAANRTMLKGNADRIYPGQVLIIPDDE